ncbi:hypothetical protein H2200_012481 [Cladophialophora chaetospira]|uniref:Uncharacterized protein n=1 Tax=Cladophialophora chaetospira TaxID=386627 RepID=A0AA39CCH4_9EURO|nr:hypothetical protein H2200_012481 [Cladophialophora chaetospira]
MSNQGYYQQGGPQYPQQAYGQPQGGYYNQGPQMNYGPPQQQYQQQGYGGPPQQVIVREKKDRGCLGAW